MMSNESLYLGGLVVTELQSLEDAVFFNTDSQQQKSLSES